MHYHLEQTAAKKQHGHFKLRTSSKKSNATLTVAGYNNMRAVYTASSKSSEPERFVWRWKKLHSGTTTKLISLLQPEHRFCRQNGPKRGQVQNWYQNEKILMVPVCLKG